MPKTVPMEKLLGPQTWDVFAAHLERTPVLSRMLTLVNEWVPGPNPNGQPLGLTKDGRRRRQGPQRIVGSGGLWLQEPGFIRDARCQIENLASKRPPKECPGEACDTCEKLTNIAKRLRERYLPRTKEG